MNASIFVSELIQIGNEQGVGKSLDFLCKVMLTNLCWMRKFEECNELLSEIDIHVLNEYCLVGLLTTTFPYRKVIQFRELFYEKVKLELLSRFDEDEVNDILVGLK